MDIVYESESVVPVKKQSLSGDMYTEMLQSYRYKIKIANISNEQFV